MTKYEIVISKLEEKEKDLTKVEKFLNQEGVELLEAVNCLLWNLSFYTDLEGVCDDSDISIIFEKYYHLQFIRSTQRYILKNNDVN